MIELLLAPLLRMIWPAAPPWVARLLATALPAIAQLVGELDQLKDRPGPRRAAFVVEEVRLLLDASLEGVPEWVALEEERRDRILLGLVELALLVHRVSARGRQGRVDLRHALRRLRTGAEAASTPVEP